MGNEGVGVSSKLCFHCSFLLAHFACSIVGSLPQNAVLHKLLQSGAFLQGVDLQKLLQCGCPVGQNTCQTTCSCPGTSPWVHSSCHKLAGLSMGCSFLQLISTCSGVGTSMGCRVTICSSMVFQELEGNNLHHHGALHGLQGNLFSSAWSTASFTYLGVCRVVSHFLAPLSHSCYLAFCILP